MNDFLKVVKNYAGFSGRAARKEYWMYMLFYMIAYIGFSILTGVFAVAGFSALGAIFGFATLALALGLLIPTLAVCVRRLHDTDHSGWWLLLGLVPLAGLYILYLLVIQGTQGPNRFGDSPIAAIDNAV